MIYNGSKLKQPNVNYFETIRVIFNLIKSHTPQHVFVIFDYSYSCLPNLAQMVIIIVMWIFCSERVFSLNFYVSLKKIFWVDDKAPIYFLLIAFLMHCILMVLHKFKIFCFVNCGDLLVYFLSAFVFSFLFVVQYIAISWVYLFRDMSLCRILKLLFCQKLLKINLW